MATIKNNIRELRKASGLSQVALAELADTSRETICRIENGAFDPTLYLALKISSALNRSVEEIFILEDCIIPHH